jgi:DNA-directed RNA polymerase subunit E'/Rpb7
MLGVVDIGEGAVYFLSVSFRQIVYSQEVTEVIVGFIRLHVGISCNAVTAVIDHLSSNRSVPVEYK